MNAHLTVTKVQSYGPDHPHRIVLRPAHDGSHPAFSPGALDGEVAFFVRDPAPFPPGVHVTITVHHGVTP